MVWIGLHGVMFLFLFSDFYKAKYLNAQRRRREAVKANGHTNGVYTNGKVKHLGNGDAPLPANGTNKGACMVSLADINFCSCKIKKTNNRQTKMTDTKTKIHK